MASFEILVYNGTISLETKEKNLNIDVVISELERQGLFQCVDEGLLGEAISRTRIGQLGAFMIGRVIDAKVEVRIASDKMTAYARIVPAIGGKNATSDLIMIELGKKGITYGIRPEAVQMLAESGYSDFIMVAEGTEATRGTDGAVGLQIPSERGKPRIDETDKANMKDLQLIFNVQPGTDLAIITPAKPGVPGWNVCGEEVAPLPVTEAKIGIGKNVEIKKLSSGIKLVVATSAGNAECRGNKIGVENFKEFKNIDVSTGNIDFEGDVVIHGDVKGGFGLKATGNIHIRGIIEKDATVICDGDMTVKNVQAAKAIVCKGTLIVVKDISGSDVVCEGDIRVGGGIILSRISGGGNLYLDRDPQNGCIRGGEVVIQGDIIARSIGSTGEVKTFVSAGTNPKLAKRYEETSEDLEEIGRKIENLELSVNTLMKKFEAEQDEKTRERLLTFQRKLYEMVSQSRKMKEQLSDLRELLQRGSRASVTVLGSIFPGVNLRVSGCMLYVRSIFSRLKFFAQDGEVRTTLP